MDIEQTYWAGNGTHQKLAEVLQENLIPVNGRAETMHGELLRCAIRIYHDRYNNGLGNADVLVNCKMPRFLLMFEEEIDDRLPPEMSVSELVRAVEKHAKRTTCVPNDWEHDELLERVIEACILIAAEQEGMAVEVKLLTALVSSKRKISTTEGSQS